MQTDRQAAGRQAHLSQSFGKAVVTPIPFWPEFCHLAMSLMSQFRTPWYSVCVCVGEVVAFLPPL